MGSRDSYRTLVEAYQQGLGRLKKQQMPFRRAISGELVGDSCISTPAIKVYYFRLRIQGWLEEQWESPIGASNIATASAIPATQEYLHGKTSQGVQPTSTSHYKQCDVAHTPRNKDRAVNTKSQHGSCTVAENLHHVPTRARGPASKCRATTTHRGPSIGPVPEDRDTTSHHADPRPPLWHAARITAALNRGPHQSSHQGITFLREEYADMMDQQQWIGAETLHDLRLQLLWDEQRIDATSPKRSDTALMDGPVKARGCNEAGGTVPLPGGRTPSHWYSLHQPNGLDRKSTKFLCLHRDNCGPSQRQPHQLGVLSEATEAASADATFSPKKSPPPTNSTNPYKKPVCYWDVYPASLKKMLKGDTTWTTKKIILGWLIDSINKTINPPDSTLSAHSA
eukprot:jgi/Psemu1/6045/gm1.6045_g